MTARPTGEPTTTATDAQRRELVAAARHLAAQQLSPGSSGNVSLRLADGILITPTGSALSRVDAAELADTTAGTGRPSKESPLHLAVYAARPDAAAIVHLHSPFATAASCLVPDADGECPIPVLTPYQRMRFPSIPIARYAKPGTEALARSVGTVAEHTGALLMANHGLIVSAVSLTAAVDLAEELESVARLFFTLAGHDFAALTAQQQAELQAAPHPRLRGAERPT